MPTLSVENYLGVLKRSGLLSEEKLTAALTEFQERLGVRAEQAPTAQLAKFLIERDLITAWQNDYLFQGKHKGFFLGKYKLLRMLGAGGMGAVFLAEHTLMRRRVAIKVLPTSHVKDQQKLRKFLDEARAIAALDHPNIIQAYNVDSQDGLYYLVMEYVEGHDLEQTVRKNGPLAPEKAVDYLRQAADGLSHAHGRKMVHRDIKPSNLLLDKAGTIKILDLGLALLAGAQPSGKPGGSGSKKDAGSGTKNSANDETSAAWSVGTNVAGTMDYLSPEQAMGSEPDARGDLYSLGCTLYFLLIGAPPFPSRTLHELLLKHQSQEPEPIAELRPDVPESLCAICRKLMAKIPADRYASADELAAELDAWLDENGVASPSRDTRRQRVTTVIARPKLPENSIRIDDEPTWTSKDNEETTEIWGPKKQTLPWGMIAGGAAAVVLSLAAVFVVLRRPSRSVADARHDAKQDAHRRSFVDKNVKWGDPVPQATARVEPPQPEPPKPQPAPGSLRDAGPNAPKLHAGPGKLGTALVCDGGFYPRYVHDPKWEPEHFTLACWVWLDTVPRGGETRRWLVSKGDNEHQDGHYGLLVNGAKVFGYLNIGGGPDHVFDLASTADLMQPRVWQHLAMTYDGKDLRLYCQGELVGARTVDKRRSNGAGDLCLGRRVDGYVPLAGKLDEVRLYNRPLSPEEVKSHAHQASLESKPERADEGLTSYWGFEEIPPAEAYAPPRTALYRVFDDEPEFLARLIEGDGKATFDLSERAAGRASCRVTPSQRYHEKFDGLDLPIRENPQLGEYRFIRFAWKKRGGESITLQLAPNGVWAHRYHAGPKSAFSPSKEVATELPSEWTVVTRDLFADYGAFSLTGVALSPSDGECGWFDAIYLARTLADFDEIEARRIAAEADWSQAPLVLQCGRKQGEVERQEAGYGFDAYQVNRHDGWDARFPRSYCWYHNETTKFKLTIPASKPGSPYPLGVLRMFFVDGNTSERKVRVIVEGREIADVENYGGGKMVAVPIRGEDASDGTIDVQIVNRAAQNAAVSVVEFLPGNGAETGKGAEAPPSP